MKQYILFLVLFVSCMQARIKRPWLRRFIIKKSQQKKIVVKPTNPINNVKQKKSTNKETTSVATYDLSGKCSAVTYELNGGRFGDNLSSYCRAIWIAYRHNIPFLYKRFKYSERLALNNYGLAMNKKVGALFKRKIIIPNHNCYDIIKNSGILYIVGWKSKISVDWRNKKFVALLKKCLTLPFLSSRFLSSEIEIPPHHISVAVHIRTGGDYGPDKKIRSKQPKRFAPHQFYIDQIKRIQSMFEGSDLYVHIFTDDAKPMALVKKFKQQLGDEHITYGCRQQGNNFHTNVLEDFFAMTTFDCLIRPESLYSMYAERLGNHKVVIYPVRTGSAGRRRKIVVQEIAIKQQTRQGYVTKKVRV